MVKRLNTTGCVLSGAGIPLQAVGGGLFRNSAIHRPEHIVGLALFVVGTALAILGFALYAKARNRTVAFGLLGLVGILGLIFIYGIDDESPDNPNR